MRASRKRKFKMLIWDILIFAMLIVNITIYKTRQKNQVHQVVHRPILIPPTIGGSKIANWINTKRIPLTNADDRTVTSLDLMFASQFLNLPTWSRAYVSCGSSSSEISCSDLYRAAEVINQWSEHLEASPKDYIVLENLTGSIGRRMGSIAAIGLLSIMLKRGILLNSVYISQKNLYFGNPFYVPREIEYVNGGDITTKLMETHTEPNVLHLDQKNFSEMNFNDKDLAHFAGLLFGAEVNPGLIYMNPSTMRFSMECFGYHAIYFLSNFFTPIPQWAVNSASDAMEHIPKTVRVMGVHFAKVINLGSVINIIKPLLVEYMKEKPAVLAVASQWEIDEEINSLLPHSMIHVDAYRLGICDRTALNDMALMMMCNDCVLNLRSSFACMIAARSGRRMYFYDELSASLLQFSSSQAGWFNGITYMTEYEEQDDDPVMDELIRITDKNEESLRLFYKYFAL